jgi:hypothetical protein
MNFFITPLLGPSSIRVYNICINKWLAILPFPSIHYLILFPDHSLTLLVAHLKRREITEDKPNVCTRTNIHSYISAVAAVLRYSDHIVSNIPNRFLYLQIWNILIQSNIKPVQERRNKQIPTAKQQRQGGSKLTFHDIVNKRDSPGLDHFDHLLLSMYTYIYPVRADYFHTEIVHGYATPSSPNYLRFYDGGAELMLTDFKTVKRYKKIHYPALPSDLYQILLQSITLFPRKFLFEFRSGKPYTRNKFSIWSSERLLRLFGVELNLTMIRHLFISTLSMELPANKLQEIGDLMGHSISVQKLYKWVDEGDEGFRGFQDEDEGDCEEDEVVDED